jgi:DNA replication protein DnaD
MKENYAKAVQDRHDVINRTEMVVSSITSFRQWLISTSQWGVCSGGMCIVIMHSTFTTLTSLQHAKRKQSERSAVNQRLSNATKGGICFLSFVANKDIIWSIMLKRTVTILQKSKITLTKTSTLKSQNSEKAANLKERYSCFLLQNFILSNLLKCRIQFWVILHRLNKC